MRAVITLSGMISDRLPHGWQVLATIFGVAAIFTLCWYLSEKGALDIAATGMSFFVLTLLRMMGGNLENRAPKEFSGTARIVDQVRSDWANWTANRKILSKAILALGITIAYLACRALTVWVMHVIASPWLALAAGLAVAAVVASPVLVKEVLRAMKAGVQG